MKRLLVTYWFFAAAVLVSASGAGTASADTCEELSKFIKKGTNIILYTEPRSDLDRRLTDLRIEYGAALASGPGVSADSYLRALKNWYETRSSSVASISQSYRADADRNLANFRRDCGKTDRSSPSR